VKRLLGLAALCALVVAAPAAARDKWDTKVLAKVGPPGFPALSLVAPDGHIYVGTYENPSGDTLPSRVLEFGPDGALGRSWVMTGQDLAKAHGIQVAARYPDGRLVLLDHSPPRALILDPRSGSDLQPFATFADLAPCGTPPCSMTITDNPPQPDYGAWGPDGSLYVTDYQQGVIWKVGPQGGAAKVWLTAPELDGGMFGTSGIVLLPDHKTLLISQGSSQGLVNGNPSTGRLYKVVIEPDGKPGPLVQLWESGPAEAPDGFAVAQSGNIYLALVGPGTNQIVEVSPSGAEVARFPADTSGANGSPVPFDEPSSVQFSGTRLIVTNLAYVSGDTSHQVLFDIEAGEPGAPVFVPGADKAKPKPKAKKKKHKRKKRHKRKRPRH
jgi:hypothetical protein